MAVALNGCANTKPVAEDAVDASPGKVDASDERTNGSTGVKPETFSDEAGAARQIIHPLGNLRLARPDGK